jgi:hypothetical protein
LQLNVDQLQLLVAIWPEQIATRVSQVATRVGAFSIKMHLGVL